MTHSSRLPLKGILSLGVRARPGLLPIPAAPCGQRCLVEVWESPKELRLCEAPALLSGSCKAISPFFLVSSVCGESEQVGKVMVGFFG